MTREEIIKNLKYTMEKHKNDNVPTFGTNISLMCKDILDYLEQEPCGDCVSRAEVKKIAKEMYLEVANMKLDVKTISDCISYTSSKCREVFERKLQTLSSVSPIKPKGHWILTDVEGNKVWHCHCSNCKKDPQDYIGGSENWWLIRNNLPKVCPNCGADMREVEE